MTNHLLGGRTDEQVTQSRPAVGREHNQVAALLTCVLADLDRRVAGQEPRASTVLAGMREVGDELVELALQHRLRIVPCHGV